jgi:hypothetical protein
MCDPCAQVWAQALTATLAKLAATEAELEAALRKIGKTPWEAYHGNACIALAGEALAKGVK